MGLVLSYRRMSFQGKRVVAFESRRASEIAQLIRLNGGDPFVAPSMREVPLEQNQPAFDFAERLFAGQFDMMILLTGVGTRYLAKLLESKYPPERFPEALRHLTMVVRGPKPAAVLREWDVPIALFAAEPNTWREVLDVTAGRPEKNIAVQEYGRSNGELISALQQRGASVATVPVYQWQLPEDTAPLREAIRRTIAGEFVASLFTTGVQIQHALEVAEEEGVSQEFKDALHHTKICSIGPTCTEALNDAGFNPAMEPSHPKMGLLVREAALSFSA